MTFAGIEQLRTHLPEDAYSPDELDAFHEVIRSSNPQALVNPGYKDSSLWVRAKLLLPGVLGTDVPRVGKPLGVTHGRAIVNGRIGSLFGRPRTDDLVRIAMVPLGSFLALPGLPSEVHKLDEHREITTIVGAISLPYVAEGSQYGGQEWDSNILLAVHALGELGAGSLVGHTQLFVGDSPARTRHGMQDMNEPSPESVAQILYDFRPNADS